MDRQDVFARAVRQLLLLAGLLTAAGCQFDPSGLRPPPGPDAGAECGNGQVEPGEGCDDGNTQLGDGCDAACRVESGWACSGSPSVCTESCGDGRLDPGEGCDDGNLAAQDGCGPACQVEPGWGCAGEPSLCTTICGDGLQVGPETCDDGNAQPGDGCDATCQAEQGWVCTGVPSTCSPLCGDGLQVGPETCDDGGSSPGDGCDATCQVEPGWDCTGSPSVCTSACGDGRVVGTEQCDDGNTDPGDGCDDACQIEPFFACTGSPSTCTCVVFADRAAVTGARDGSTWQNAFTGIQAAVDAAAARAASFGTCEVWVAAGIYPLWNGVNSDGIQLRSQVALYGGFVGGETSRSARDPETNRTVLEGANPGNPAQKVPHVVRADGVSGARINGFYIQHGETYGEGGGGIRVTGGEVWIETCWLQDNLALYGGAVFVDGGTAHLVDVTIGPNTATAGGGGLAAAGAQVTVSQSRIAGPHANGEGGCIRVSGGTLTVEDTDLQSCSAAGVGGGIRALDGAQVTLTGAWIEQCEGSDGGGIYMNGGNLALSGSRISNSEAIGIGGGLALFGVTANLDHVRIDGNTAGGHGGGIYQSTGSMTLSVGLLASNQGAGGGGLAIYSANADLTHVTAWGNQATIPSEGGAFYGSGATVTGTNLIVWGNGAPPARMNASTLSLSYCIVQGGASGQGNLSLDPLLAAPGSGDFHLSPGSPAIDAADGDRCPPTDLDGASRYDDPATPNTGPGAVPYCDMGAFELH